VLLPLPFSVSVRLAAALNPKLTDLRFLIGGDASNGFDEPPSCPCIFSVVTI
jgi:hypothetical protein